MVQGGHFTSAPLQKNGQMLVETFWTLFDKIYPVCGPLVPFLIKNSRKIAVKLNLEILVEGLDFSIFGVLGAPGRGLGARA